MGVLGYLLTAGGLRNGFRSLPVKGRGLGKGFREGGMGVDKNKQAATTIYFNLYAPHFGIIHYKRLDYWWCLCLWLFRRNGSKNGSTHRKVFQADGGVHCRYHLYC